MVLPATETGASAIRVLLERRSELDPPAAQPLFFGKRHSLFGCYHQPASDAALDRCVVCCYPALVEYMTLHRFFKNLAEKLARAGFHVLRFDYQGTGDSQGNLEEMRIDDWVRNVTEAVQFLCKRAGVTGASLVGVRLGASLALMASASLGHVEAAVVWDAVVDGRAYVEELESVGTIRGAAAVRRARCEPAASIDYRDFLGYCVHTNWLADIMAIDLSRPHVGPVRRILWIDTEGRRESERLRGLFTALGVDVAHLIVDAAPLVPDDPYALISPAAVVREIVAWV